MTTEPCEAKTLVVPQKINVKTRHAVGVKSNLKASEVQYSTDVHIPLLCICV